MGYNKLVKEIRNHLAKFPENANALFKVIEEEIDVPKLTGIICPFCESGEYKYERSGKIVCDCSDEVQRRHNAGW